MLVVGEHIGILGQLCFICENAELFVFFVGVGVVSLAGSDFWAFGVEQDSEVGFPFAVEFVDEVDEGFSGFLFRVGEVQSDDIHACRGDSGEFFFVVLVGDGGDDFCFVHRGGKEKGKKFE